MLEVSRNQFSKRCLRQRCDDSLPQTGLESLEIENTDRND